MPCFEVLPHIYTLARTVHTLSCLFCTPSPSFHLIHVFLDASKGMAGFIRLHALIQPAL